MIDPFKEEEAALERARPSGKTAARLYEAGCFNEEGFILYGVLERLAIQGRLVFMGRTGGQMDAALHYALPNPTASKAAA